MMLIKGAGAKEFKESEEFKEFKEKEPGDRNSQI